MGSSGLPGESFGLPAGSRIKRLSADPDGWELHTPHESLPPDVKKALTAAEKQRRYRQRKGDAYRKANRERMRRKRGGN